jgi:Asp-tRNA(Asn)/Glu-tRNA(Gln) amidotransferase A subunit family amidase
VPPRTAVEQVERALGLARAHAELGATWSLDIAGAGQAAEAVDADGGRRLHGLPILVKDSIEVAGMPGGAGGPARMGRRDADVVSLCRRAGAVILGKAAMHQLAWGMSGQCPGQPACHNPRAPGCQPGGSSSGSAAAVAAGIVRVALGTDTGGSVRLPAAWCGVVGFKPAQGALPMRGVAPLARPMDTVGYLAASVDECRRFHETLTGTAQDHATSARRLAVAVDPDLLRDLEPPVRAAFDRGLEALHDAGALIVEEALPGHRVPIGAMYAAALAAEWSEVVDAAPERFGEDVRAGIAAGRRADAREVRDGWAARERIRREATLRADAFACPAAPIVAPPLTSPDDVGTAGRLLRPFNVLDWPAISVPSRNAGTPVGFQLAAPREREAVLWALARTVEAAA